MGPLEQQGKIPAETQLKYDVECLLNYGIRHQLLAQADRIQVLNAILDLLKLDEPWSENDHETSRPEQVPESLTIVLDRIVDAAADKGLIAGQSMTERDLFDTRLMGLLMPRQSEVEQRFYQIAEQSGIRQATDHFYASAQACNYIRMDRIAKNKVWQTRTDFGDLDITINLSKPEKDPKEIAAERAAPKGNYPKCVLCLENVGYVGRLNHPARQNHRVIPITLADSPWYLQYSPYVYYPEHCIVFSREHTPMRITSDTFRRLLQFTEKFPHYFIGSNADLPIVGGSILNHDHFQGGHHVFAMEKAGALQTYQHADYPDIEAAILKWPMSVVRLRAKKMESLTSLASKLLVAWREYEDAETEIIAYTFDEQGQRTPHNTITPICRKTKDGRYELDLVLRNNRTSAQHPDGIFHPHRELHHIKKENIGLIEVMGLAVLPGRLTVELDRIADLLTGAVAYDADKVACDERLVKHQAWIETLLQQHGSAMRREQADQLLQAEVARKFLQVLHHAGVFKANHNGRKAFHRWMKFAGF